MIQSTQRIQRHALLLTLPLIVTASFHSHSQFRPILTEPPTEVLQGELEVRLFGLNIEELQRVNFMPTVPGTLPTLSTSITTVGMDLVPLDRGYRVTEHPYFDYFVSPGKVWVGTDGRNYGSLPFTLVHRWVNCAYNGVVDFAYAEGETSDGKVYINQETCHFLKFNTSGSVQLRYTPRRLESEAEVEAFIAEKQRRLSVQPLTAFTERFGVDANRFLEGLPDGDDLTIAGIYYEGAHYSTACRTRGDDYPHCDHMLFTSFSTAKSAYPSVVLMHLAQQYGLDIYQTRVAELLPEAESSPGEWTAVTFNHLTDMSTGNYNIDLPLADPTPGNFYGLTDTATKLRDALSWKNTRSPGIRFNYQTADTFILAVALDRHLQKIEAGSDSFEYLVDNVYRPLGLSPEVMHTRRTRDDGNNNSGTAFGGMGMFWDRDSIVRLARFLSLEGGKVGDDQLLHPQALAATLFRNNRDLGLNTRMFGNRYNNGMWGAPAHLLHDSLADCPTFVPNMSGLSGVKVFLMPNGLIFYYFNDTQQFPMDSIAVANEVKPFCEPQESAPSSAGD